MDDEPVAGIAQALEEIQAFARSMCDDAEDPDAMQRLILRCTDTRLTYTVLDAGSCGSNIAGFLKPGRAHIMVRNCLNRILRQRSRERAIAASGEMGEPAWSVDIHPVTFSVLHHDGINPALAALLGESVNADTPLARAAKGSALRIGDAKLIAGRVSVSTISGTGHPTEDIVSVHEDTQLMQKVMIRGALPDTVVNVLPGHTLGDVTNHPKLARASHVRILAAHRSDDVLTLDVEDVRMTLAPAPSGTPWLRFPWFIPAD